MVRASTTIALCLLSLLAVPQTGEAGQIQGGSQERQTMEALRGRATSLNSRIEAGRDRPLYQCRAADLELRTWTIAESLTAIEQPNPPADLAARIETAIVETEGLLDALDRGQDSLARQRGMVVRGFRVSGQNHPQPYGIHVPQAYDADKAWPLFIYLHGGSRMDQDRFALDRVAPATPASQPATQPAASVAAAPIDRMLKIWVPRRGKSWTEPANEESFFAAIADVKANYHVDINRIYVQGFSLGGFATVHYAVRFPDTFAGAGPSSMTKDYDALPLAENLTNLPMYLCHGTLDDVCDVKTTAGLFDRLKDLRYEAVFQEEVRLQHQSTDLARASQESWLLTKTRNPWPDKLVYVTDNARYHHAYWIDILQLETLPDKSFARVEAIRSGPGRFAVRTQRIRSLAILLAEAIAPPGEPVTVSINDEQARTYPWPEGGQLVLQIPAASRPQGSARQ
jgi:predicted esterase